VKLRRVFRFALAVSILAGCTATAPRGHEDHATPTAGIVARSSDGLVSAEYVPQYDLMFVPAGTPGSQQLNVLIRLAAAHDEGATARPDLDLVIVLDRSGSMSGDKLHYAKQASIDLLGRLESRDRVTLITYDAHITTLALARAADLAGTFEMRQALLGVRPGGSTALGPALFEALDVFEQQDHDGRLAHVLLLSDGHANVGERRPAVIAARVGQGYGHGTTVSALGVGADYNEELLALVADQGGGRYHFIESAPQIPSVLEDEFAGLASTVAAELAIEFAGKPPVSVDTVHGYVSETDARQTTIRVGYLSSGQSREIIAQLDIPNAMLLGQPGERLELGTFTVRYRPVDSAAGADASIVEVKLPATVTLAGAAEQMLGSEHVDVTVRVAELEAAASLRAVSQAVERADFDAADRVFEQAEARLDDRLENVTDDAERRRLQAERDKLEAAHSALEQAKRSGEDRKLVVKSYRKDAIKLSKGESALGDI
jgi:Ca-activated chloride channel family protein